MLTSAGLVSVVNENQVNKLSEFGAYSQRIAGANPSGVKKDSYAITNTALQACPTTNSIWAAAATPLPPTPNPALCDCMTDAAGCVLSDSVPTSKYGELFHILCGLTDCGDIITNSVEGKYGNYSMCEPRQQLNIILNKYYEEKGLDTNACHFDGSAMSKVPSRTVDVCAAMAKEGEEVTEESIETVSPDPSHTSSSTPCSCTCLCMGMDVAGTSRSRGGAVTHLRVNVGIGSFQLALYILTAVVTGLGMVIL